MRAIIENEFADRGREPTSAFREGLAVILSANIVRGDTLRDAQSIRLVEWEAGDAETFIRTPTFLEEPAYDLFYVAPEPLAPVHYSELASYAVL